VLVPGVTGIAGTLRSGGLATSSSAGGQDARLHCDLILVSFLGKRLRPCGAVVGSLRQFGAFHFEEVQVGGGRSIIGGTTRGDRLGLHRDLVCP